jgi:hypothetical protein
MTRREHHVRPGTARTRARGAALVVAALMTVLLVAGAVPAGAAQGSGASILSVSSTSLPAGQTSTVTLMGTDYLVPPHAPDTHLFGGVYVFFGWVAGGPWGPSNRNSANNNGAFGYTYSYRGDGGDASTRDDGTGRVRLVAFTPGGVSGDATPFHMDDNGNWSATLTIEGSTYTFIDPATGAPKTVSCQQVQCGVFTIGAHGIASATNERFVPINFVGAPAVAPPPGVPGPGGAVVPDAGPGGSGGPGGSSGGPTPTGAASEDPSIPTTVITAPPTTSTTTKAQSKGASGSKDDPIELAASNASSSESSSGLPIVGGAVVLLIAAGGGTWIWRRRRSGEAS